MVTKSLHKKGSHVFEIRYGLFDPIDRIGVWDELQDTRIGGNDNYVVSPDPQIYPRGLKDVLDFLHNLHAQHFLPQVITSFNNVRTQFIRVKMAKG